MSKRPKPVEGVYEKTPGSGTWYTRLRVDGKLIRKAVGSRAEAIAYIEKARTIRRTGHGILPSTARRPARTFAELEKTGGDVLLSELCDEYLDHLLDPKNPDQPRDLLNPPQRIKAIRNAFGERPAALIAPHEITDWLKSLPVASATMNRYKSVFSAIYRFGKTRSRVQVNPVRDVKQFRVQLGPPRYLKPAEEKRLYNVLAHWISDCPLKNKLRRLELQCHPYEVDIAIGTGLRKANQYAMRWEWVDFRNRTLSVPSTKTGKPLTLPMIERVFVALKALEKLQSELEELRAEFNPERDRTRMVANGRVFHIRENRQWWSRALREAKIEDFRWHDLRHTTASLMAQAGAPLKAIQEALGHGSIATTSRYAHMNQSALADAMSVLNRTAS